MASPRRDHWDIGYIQGPRGLGGELRLKLHNPDATVLDGGRVRLIARDGSIAEHDIVDGQWQGASSAFIKLDGVGDRSAAESMTGATVQVDRSWFEPDALPSVALIGAPAVNAETDEPLGEVTDVLHNGAQAVLQIGEAEHLVPLVDALVTIDDAGTVRVVPMPGLIDG